MLGMAFVYARGKVRIDAITLLGVVAFAISGRTAFSASAEPRNFRKPYNAGHLPALAAVMILFALVLQARPASAASTVFSYALTTTTDPVVPGGAAVFTVTVTNLTNADQEYELCHAVPQFTQQGASSAGTALCTNNTTVLAGTSTSFIIDLSVLNGISTPPNGTLINLTLTDMNDGAMISRIVTVQSAPEAGLALSIPNGTVIPGDRLPPR
jgi:hypothetical protein